MGLNSYLNQSITTMNLSLFATFVISLTHMSFGSKICKTHGEPTSPPVNGCTYYLPTDYGLPENKKLKEISMNRKILGGLHGWWGKVIEKDVPLLSYENFLKIANFTLNRVLFLDSTDCSETIGCGQYREYKKHGYKSGYSYDVWKSNTEQCLSIRNLDGLIAHQCRFDKERGRNCVYSITSILGLESVGCKDGYPYVVC